MKFENILEWYSGKARERIVNFAIPTLAECEELGYWKKGVSRTLKAALNKQNEARKFIDKSLTKRKQLAGSDAKVTNGDLLENLHGAKHTTKEMERGLGTHEKGFYLAHAMRFGSFGLAKKNIALAERLQPYAEKADRETFEAWGAALRWAKAFEPVAELIKLLDSRRPKPVIAFGGTLSPTVWANVGRAMEIEMSTLGAPPSHGEWVEKEMLINGKMQKVSVWEVTIDWPKGTKHNMSKFVRNQESGNWLCQACGHAIKNPYNWVPLLAYTKPDKVHGTPLSLWVGRDCAQKLFGCEVEGDAIYKNR